MPVGIHPARNELYSFSPTDLAISYCKLGQVGDFCLAKVMQIEGNSVRIASQDFSISDGVF